MLTLSLPSCCFAAIANLFLGSTYVSGDDTNDASAYNQAGSETAQNEGPYTETDRKSQLCL